ncbi:unnamed protein product [Sphagnum jensenii]
MLAAFSQEWGLINVVTVEEFPLTVGQVSYTIGTGGNFNTVRPDSIFNQWIYDTQAGIRYPLKQLADNQYNSITLNTIPSIPKGIFYDPQYPLGVIYIYPTAGLSTYQLWLESYKPMAQFSTLTSTMNLPGEYFQSLIYLLTEQLAPEYGYELSQQQTANIANSKMYLKARNFRRSVANFDPGINGQGRVVGGTILDGFIS